MAFTAVRRGGAVSIVGVYGTRYANFPLGQLIDKNLRVRGGQAPVHEYIDELISLIQTGRLRTDDVISHVMPLEDVALGYEIFNDKRDGCVKVVLQPS
jgi:threonine dehydrogenase-like Zn-dependent dehydrogenase